MTRLRAILHRLAEAAVTVFGVFFLPLVMLFGKAYITPVLLDALASRIAATVERSGRETHEQLLQTNLLLARLADRLAPLPPATPDKPPEQHDQGMAES